MLNRSRSIAAVLGMALAMSGSGLAQAVPVPRTVMTNKKKRGLFNDLVFPQWQMPYGRKGAQLSVAQGKRNAKKARNVKRHRAACRG
jgi:hypothetical protein